MNTTEHLEEAYSNKAYTFVQDLEQKGVNSVKGIACKKQSTVKVSTRYISSKLLINPKMSLASFISNCIDMFCFPNEETSQIYAHHKIIKVLPYLLMTDTDSGSLEFKVIAEDSCDCGECEMRDILMKMFLVKGVHHRLDLSGEFFEQYGKRNELVCKQVSLYESENMEQGIICMICASPKEHFELYGIYYKTNKKHKGLHKGTKGMDFNNYASQILTMDEAEEGTRRFAKKQKQTWFQNKKGNMVMIMIKKSEFGQLNDKRFILPDGINSLPYGHLDPKKYIEDFKKSLLPLTPEQIIRYHHHFNLGRYEQCILERNKRMRVINNVPLQQPIFYKRGLLKRTQFQISKNITVFLLQGLWQKICFCHGKS